MSEIRYPYDLYPPTDPDLINLVAKIRETEAHLQALRNEYARLANQIYRPDRGREVARTQARMYERAAAADQEERERASAVAQQNIAAQQAEERRREQARREIEQTLGREL